MKTSASAIRSIRMGEIGVAGNGLLLQALLGSCLGLVLHDRKRQIGGLAHILLPSAPANSPGQPPPPGKYVDTAIPFLIAEMERRATGQQQLQAKLFGAASMFGSAVPDWHVGPQNIAACERILDDLQIPVIGRHCGGHQGRRITLDGRTGEVRVAMVGQSTVVI